MLDYIANRLILRLKKNDKAYMFARMLKERNSEELHEIIKSYYEGMDDFFDEALWQLV